MLWSLIGIAVLVWMIFGPARIPCRLGKHEWRYVSDRARSFPVPTDERTCRRCRRREEWNFYSNRTQGWA
jgi:hypothetical protein